MRPSVPTRRFNDRSIVFLKFTLRQARLSSLPPKKTNAHPPVKLGQIVATARQSIPLDGKRVRQTLATLVAAQLEVPRS